VVNLDGINNENVVIVFSPEGITENTDETYDIELYVKNVEQFGAYELDLAFNPDLMQVLSIKQGDFIGSTNRKAHQLGNAIDNKIGRINYSVTTFGSQIKGASGRGVLLRIHCKPLQSIFELPTLERAQLVRIDAKVIDYTFKTNKINSDHSVDTYIISTYPSPFKENMSIQYHVGQAGSITFKFYNVYGALLRSSEEMEMKTGNYSKSFNDLGLSAGVYIVSLECNGEINDTERIIVY